MSLADAEWIFHHVLTGTAYALGAVTVLLVLWPFGARPPLAAALFGFAAVPLLCVLIAEAATRHWYDTPGTLGTGSLFIVLPAATAGAAAALVLSLAGVFGLPAANWRAQPGIWLGLTASLSAVALLLWRVWPTPRPRLF
ncbi:hypothetical protein [Polymorphum gilvum]|uniref:Transmembrane protein n=1 Tax=Polymorphum gilvum (strain LMG 25793 / CGMCC 1.9160 / SL003B-26A1) TaxID=991905 RepID=F2IYI2_POLGS|nr:hypothetical protein [Polymorphum gilvum]ADZ68495.1 hypothetical protein SL003B_0056 [Polymorphum gilvum SL003B-26A1]